MQRQLAIALRAGEERKGVSWQLEGNCGHFRRIYEWSLTNGVKGPGVIIQKIDRSFDIYDYATKKQLTAAEVDTYTGNATLLNGWTTYWEAWTVATNKTAPTRGDQFLFAGAGNPANRKTTKGWYKITGTATFHKFVKATVDQMNQALASAGMATDNGPANGLYCSKADPTTKVDAKGNAYIPAAVGNPVVNSAKVTWDSDVADPTNKGWWGESVVT